MRLRQRDESEVAIAPPGGWIMGPRSHIHLHLLMERPVRVTKRCAHDAANQLSKWTFFWMIPLFRLGFRKQLTLEDLDECCREDEPTRVSLLLQRFVQETLSLLRISFSLPTRN